MNDSPVPVGDRTAQPLDQVVADTTSPFAPSNVHGFVGHVSLTDSDGVAVLAVDRPPANALDVDALDELIAAIGQVAADPPRALVLTGRDGFFSAGADLNAIPSYGPAEQRRMVAGINAMALAVYGLECPVVGAITGHAIAGGLVLALCTDVRVASSQGRYGLTEVKVGVPYPQAAIGIVRAELAPHAVRVLAFGNGLVDGHEALRLGVFDEVVDPLSVVPRATEIARELAAFPPDAYKRTKRDLRGHTVEQLRAAAAHDPLLAQWVG